MDLVLELQLWKQYKRASFRRIIILLVAWHFIYLHTKYFSTSWTDQNLIPYYNKYLPHFASSKH